MVCKNFCSVNSFEFQNLDSTQIKAGLEQEPSFYFLRDVLITHNISTFTELDQFASANLNQRTEFYRDICQVHDFFTEIKRINGVVSTEHPYFPVPSAGQNFYCRQT